MDFLERLRAGLARTRQGWVQRLEALFRRPLDEEALATMEEILISADVGLKATRRLIEAVRRSYPGDRGQGASDLSVCLQQEIIRILRGAEGAAVAPLRFSVRPWIAMFVGVNGVGKTTTIGKLAAQQCRAGKRVLLVAADTFRAAALEQLEIWGQRAGVEVVKHRPGQDPSGVVFDAVHAARKRAADSVLIDTAGRLHTKAHLLEELKKIRRVIDREEAGAPHETLLVLDATTGQNAFQQARVFQGSLPITGIVLTKLDGTAKGGVVLAIREELGIPVQYIGVGEGVEDLHPFDSPQFAHALFAPDPNKLDNPWT